MKKDFSIEAMLLKNCYLPKLSMCFSTFIDDNCF
jgi:hypothetical protein